MIRNPDTDDYRLYIVTVERSGARPKRTNEGPYHFPKAGDALRWITTIADREVVGASLYHGTEPVAQVGDLL